MPNYNTRREYNADQFSDLLVQQYAQQLTSLYNLGARKFVIAGKLILESTILTVMVVSLTLYTFYATRKGYGFSFLGPFLFAGIMIIMVFALIQLFFPIGRIAYMIYGAVAALIFCGYIIYDTDKLKKRYSYDEYVWASVSHISTSLTELRSFYNLLLEHVLF